MEENRIFGSDVSLPSLPCLQSDCEEEILHLMKEVDAVFEEKHHELLNELRNVRSLCRAQSNEIENLRCQLIPGHELTDAYQTQRNILSNKDNSSEISALKKENDDLKTANNSLRQQLQRLPEGEIQLVSLKKSLTIQQEENRALKERLLKVNQQYDTLRNSYQRLVNTLAAHRQGNVKPTGHKIDEPSSSSDFVASQISQTAQKYLSEETEFCNEFQSKINQEIEDLEKRLRREIV